MIEAVKARHGLYKLGEEEELAGDDYLSNKHSRFIKMFRYPRSIITVNTYRTFLFSIKNQSKKYFYTSISDANNVLFLNECFTPRKNIFWSNFGYSLSN